MEWPTVSSEKISKKETTKDFITERLSETMSRLWSKENKDGSTSELTIISHWTADKFTEHIKDKKYESKTV